MSKLTRAQSKTGKTGKLGIPADFVVKTGIVEILEKKYDKIVFEGKKNDKSQVNGLRASWEPDTPKKGRNKVKGKYHLTKRGKGPDGDSGK